MIILQPTHTTGMYCEPPFGWLRFVSHSNFNCVMGMNEFLVL